MLCSNHVCHVLPALRHISLTLPASFRGKSHSSRLDLEHQHSNLYAISGEPSCSLCCAAAALLEGFLWCCTPAPILS